MRNNGMMCKQPQFYAKAVYVIAVLLVCAVQTAQANPLDPSVVSGQASFASSGNTLTVTNTPGTIINWQGFSIGASETTRFNQQSASSAVLNRVISSNPSSILGTLQSNGRVFLINPNGIVFGAGAVVDVAGLVASTLNLSDADFIAGNHHYTQIPGAANISNAGNITATQGNEQGGGQIFLIAPDVENTGIITAPNGEILLVAGHSVDLVSTNDPNLRVNITAPAGDITNVGQLIAESGSLGLFGAVVRNNGMISASSVAVQDGTIVFRVSPRIETGGTISSGAGGCISSGAGSTTGNDMCGEIKIPTNMQSTTISPSLFLLEPPYLTLPQVGEVHGGSLLTTLSVENVVINVGVIAAVDVGELVASALNFGDADYLTRHHRYLSSLSQVRERSAVHVANQGNIPAQYGRQILLIAPNVEKTDIITAPNGEILLAAGHSVDLVSSSDPNLRVNITAAAGDATNVGQLIAESGSLGLFGAVVRNNGIVSANSAALQGSEIVFRVNQQVKADSTISLTDTLDVSPDLAPLAALSP